MELAKAIAVPASFVSRMANGKKDVPFALCMPIERATNGEVTRADLRPEDYLQHWPELANTQPLSPPVAIETVAHVQAAIQHVEVVAVTAIREEATEALAQIGNIADAVMERLDADGKPWDGTERREEDLPWDSRTERRKLGAPIDRRVSAESVAQAKFKARQGAKQADGS